MQALAERTRRTTYLSMLPRRVDRFETQSQPTRRVRLRHIERALPWASLFTLVVSLAGAMSVGVTSTATGADTPATTGRLRTIGGVLEESAADTLGPKDVLTLRRFQEAQVVVIITMDGAAGSADVYCDTTRDRAPFDKVHATSETVMDVFRHFCSAQTE
jgi:hypothetical protein